MKTLIADLPATQINGYLSKMQEDINKGFESGTIDGREWRLSNEHPDDEIEELKTKIKELS